MSNSKNDVKEGEDEEQPQEPFPIPRVNTVSNPKKGLLPKYEPRGENFNPDLFQLFYSLVNFHIKPYELDPGQEFSPALETFCTAFDDGEASSRKVDPATFNEPENLVARTHIVRKFLLECQNQLFSLSSNPNLTKIAVLHNELFYAGEVLRHHKPDKSMMSFCDMLMAETLDLYNSAVSKIINEKYWDANKTAEDLINDLLKKEILTIRNLNRETFSLLSQCLIKRSLDKAPAAQAAAIKTWSSKNDITFDETK